MENAQTAAPADWKKFLLLDCGLLSASVLWLVKLHQGSGHFDLEQALPWALCFAVLSSLGAWSLGAYRVAQGVQPRALLSLPLAFAVFWLLPWQAPSVGLLAAQAVSLFGLLHGLRIAHARSGGRLEGRRVLVVGAGAEAAAVRGVLEQSRSARLVGFYALDDTQPALTPAVSGALPLSETARALGITDIVVAVRERRGGRVPQDELLDCRLNGVRVSDLSSFFERASGQVRIDTLQPSWLIYGEGFRQGAARAAIKRGVDLVLGSAMLVTAAPLMALVALLVVADSRGPVFYRQERVGRGGRLFRVIKFRSMGLDAERDGRPRWAQSNDARVTRVGRVIRRFRIDELPQLWNVIRGEMSLVGPRPERPYFVSQLAAEVPFYALRHSVKPGLTGWAQVRYHYGDTVRDAVEKLQYDLYYLKHGSLLFDARILFSTLRVVLTGQGAH